jgi:hypothetical protein
LKVNPVDLKQVGVTYEEMQAAGYSLSELLPVYFS